MQTLTSDYIKFKYLILYTGTDAGMNTTFNGEAIDVVWLNDRDITIKLRDDENLIKYNGEYYLVYKWINKIPPTPKSSLDGGHV